MKEKHIAIIVLHYKNLNDTRACLASLQKITYPDCSVIVVNNDSPDHLEKLKTEFPSCAYIQNKENLGFAEGNNVGMRHALANQGVDAILLINNDTEVAPDFLERMKKIQADMIAPRMVQYDYRDKVDNLGIVLMSSGLAFNRTRENQKLFCPSAGCALYSRKLLEAVAFDSPSGSIWYFDPTYFMYAEDLDLGWRARSQGFKPAYAKDAVIYHKGSAAAGKLSDMAVYHTYRNLLWAQFTNLPALVLLWQLPWLCAGWTFIIALYLLKARPIIITKALFGGIGGMLTMSQKKSLAQKRIKVSKKIILSWFETGLFPLRRY